MNMKHFKYILPLALLAMIGASITSCDDMLDMGNDDVLYADENHLTQGTDTVNSFVGILAQLQKIAVRTNLYGELRGDLVVVNDNADADLKAISNFEVSDSNAYNNPRDYYAVINNCNYYLANADTTLMERRYDATTLSAYDFRVFQAEYCAVRAIRAWVYLQLGQVYGDNIPLVTEPILSLDDANNILAKRSPSFRSVTISSMTSSPTCPGSPIPTITRPTATPCPAAWLSCPFSSFWVTSIWRADNMSKLLRLTSTTLSTTV